jgi:DNA-directed RNA polymerase specialized sigma24 family protein
VNRRRSSGVYLPMESTPLHLGPVRIDGRRAGTPTNRADTNRADTNWDRLDGDDLEVVGPQPLAELTEAEDSPPPSAAHEPDGGEAFAAFYRAEYANVARALSYTLGDIDLGREASDEAMARAYAHWSKIRDYESPAGWVYRVGLNWAYSARRRVLRALPFVEHSHASQPPISDPAVADALRRLDVKLRSVVVCRLLLDWSVDETAAALRIKPGTVKSRLHRALTSLERSLGHMRSSR